MDAEIVSLTRRETIRCRPCHGRFWTCFGPVRVQKPPSGQTRKATVGGP